MNNSKFWTSSLTSMCLCVGATLAATVVLPAVADDDQSGGSGGHHHGCCVDWSKLNLTPTQSMQIQTLENEWTKTYNDIRPEIVDEQQRLTKMLADHNSDPVEVMALQQSVARKKAQLNGLATANYLKKRQVLTEAQQYSLEQQIKEVVRRRQNQLYPGTQSDAVVTDHIQNLMNRVRNIWPVQSER